jgi:hypothetical protein
MSGDQYLLMDAEDMALMQAEMQRKEPGLSSISTADLVKELKSRHELCPVLDEMDQPVCMFVSTTKSLVKELERREGVTKYHVENGQQCSIQINNEVVDFTNHMPAAWILEVLK